MSMEEQKPRLQLEQERERLERAVPVRQRTIVAARWLLPQRGGLELEARGDELWIENQTGRDLSGLVLWRDGACFHVPRLARGQRARAESISAEQAEARAPKLPAGSVAGNGATLAGSIMTGRLGGNRYAARYAWSPASSGLVDDSGVAARAGDQHVLAGVF